MATAASDDERHSPDWARPDFSVQKVILLGNSWRQRSSVGNLILGKTVFDTETEPRQFQLRKEELHNTHITVINTPDLLQPDLAANRLTKLVTEIAVASAPGPHVFLLVLQPEDFTEQQKSSLQSVLKMFSEQAFRHALLLISTPRAGITGFMQKKHPQLQDMIRSCQYRYLCCFDLDKEELMTRLEQLMKENNGEHVVLKYSYQTQHREDPPHKQGQSQCFRIILFGKNEDTKQELINIITGNKSKGRFQEGVKSQMTKNKVEEFNRKKIKVVKTSNLFSQSVAAVREEMKRCVSLCSPGPNVLLLLVKPSDFTEDNMETLRFILSLFGPDVFKHSMVVLRDQRSSTCQKWVEDLISDCENRSYSKDKINCDEIMVELENILKRNIGSYVSLSNQKPTRPSLNLVLCGSSEAEKTSAVKSILGRAELPAASSPGHCVYHQGEVGGYWVSLVELPTLSGKPLQAVMQQCLHCISLCAPQGVHAFIWVLPLGSLTDEDKAEFKIIQDTLRSRVLHFSLILVTVDSVATAPPVRRNRDLQEYSQNCGGGYLMFNTRNQQHVSELLESVEKLRAKNVPHSFTTEMFLQGQIQNYIELHKEHTSMTTGQNMTCEEKQSNDCLRIVLIGKTGSGKSSSGNTILGRKEFKSETSQKSVTRGCDKAKTEVDGRSIAVVDTPGLFDTTMSNECIIDEMTRCVSLLAPGPHVFLLTLSIGRFTEEEKETLKHIQTGFGKDAQMFTIILLTHGDNLEADGMSIEDFIRDKCDASFKKLISDCGNRYHVFNNREQSDRTQLKELLQKIDNMVKENGGGCYTNKLLQEAEAAIRKEMERILKEKEEEMKRERELLESKHKQEVEQMKQELEEQKSKIENERRQREQELKEKEEKIQAEQDQRKREKEQRDADDRKRKDEEEQKLREWEQKRNDLEKKIKSEEESKETIDRKLQEISKQMEDEKKKWQTGWENRNQEEERRRQEEEQKIKKLKDEYNEQREKDTNKREEEDRIRQVQEEKERQKLEEKHQKQVEELQKAFEEEARKKAEEFNDFKNKKEAEKETLLHQHIVEVEILQQQYEDEKTDMRKNFDSTLSEKEMSLKDDITKLQCNHEQEMGDIVILLLTQKKTNKENIRLLKKSHKQQLKKLEEDITSKFKRKEREEITQLKKQQKLERDKLAFEIKINEKLKEMRAKMRLQHEMDIIKLKDTLLEEQMQDLKTETSKLKKKQKEELAEHTQKLREDHEEMENEHLAKLQTKHDQEMKELKERVQAEGGVCREELEELEQELDRKHNNKIKELKEKLLIPEEKSCKVG